MKLAFRKVHGLGNDFLLLDGRSGPLALHPALVATLCDRRRGLGADGVLVLEAGTSDGRMRLRNRDGSEAEMCGNAIRCLARHLYLESGRAKSEFTIDTLAGPRLCRVVREAGPVCIVEVDMGEAALDQHQRQALGEGQSLLVEVMGQPVDLHLVSMGNPHAVVVGWVDEASAAILGPAMEGLPAFPERTNVEWVRPLGPDRLEVRVWERGVGLTAACGTGACAAAVVARRLGLTATDQMTVHLPGGLLKIRLCDSRVFMEGPAVEVAAGEIDVEALLA